jgi:hypothetical protein
MAKSPTPTELTKPFLVEILTYTPTQFFHCQHCEFVWQQAGAGAAFHQEQLDSSIPDDLKKEYADLSLWVRETAGQYGGRVLFKIIDAASLEGVYKSLRYGTRRYPAFVIERSVKFTGTDFADLKQRISGHLQTLTVTGTERDA